MKKLATSLLLAFFVFAPTGVYAFDLFPNEVCSDATNSAVCEDGNTTSDNPVAELIGDIARIIAIFVGVVAVIAIVIGGFWYVTAGGDSGRMAKARSTILYALVGAVVTALAATIIIFFTNRLL